MNTSKPGWKTTEFWMTTLLHVASVASVLTSVLPPQYAAIASAVAQLGYSVARGASKLNANETGASIALVAEASKALGPSLLAADASGDGAARKRGRPAKVAPESAE